MMIHFCQSVRGPLTNWDKREWKQACKLITRKDGSRFTPEQLKQVFLDHLANGHEVIPISDCDNFDYKKGCMGHDEDKP